MRAEGIDVAPKVRVRLAARARRDLLQLEDAIDREPAQADAPRVVAVADGLVAHREPRDGAVERVRPLQARILAEHARRVLEGHGTARVDLRCVHERGLPPRDDHHDREVERHRDGAREEDHVEDARAADADDRAHATGRAGAHVAHVREVRADERAERPGRVREGRAPREATERGDERESEGRRDGKEEVRIAREDAFLGREDDDPPRDERDERDAEHGREEAQLVVADPRGDEHDRHDGAAHVHGEGRVAEDGERHVRGPAAQAPEADERDLARAEAALFEHVGPRAVERVEEADAAQREDEAPRDLGKVERRERRWGGLPILGERRVASAFPRDRARALFRPAGSPALVARWRRWIFGSSVPLDEFARQLQRSLGARGLAVKTGERFEPLRAAARAGARRAGRGTRSEGGAG